MDLSEEKCYIFNSNKNKTFKKPELQNVFKKQCMMILPNYIYNRIFS